MKSNTIWALVTGLAVGFLVGREWSGGKTGDTPTKPGSSSGGTAHGPTDIPKDWLTEKDFNSPDALTGLTPQQRYAVLKIMNEKPCDCGCPHGSFAKCKKDDPACPRAPKVVEQAVAMAKQGKSYDEMAAALKKPDAPAAQQPPAAGPQKIEVAAWTPVKGPKYAKVTIVEYSDFQ